MSEQETGRWEVVGRSGVVGMHAALMHSSQVLFFCRPEEPSHRQADPNEPNHNGFPNDEQFDASNGDQALSSIFPLTGDGRFRPLPLQVEHNPFCAGHCHLADGRLLVAGGDKRADSGDSGKDYKRAPRGTKPGLRGLRLFSAGAADRPDAGEWQTIGTISGPRWYPSCTLLPDGRVFVVSGSIDDQDVLPNLNPTCELIPPLSDGPQLLPFLFEAWPYHSYPFVDVLPTGEIFIFARNTAHYLSLDQQADREKFSIRPGAKLSRPAKHYPNNAAVVTLPLQLDDTAARVLIIGGSSRDIYSHWVTGSHHQAAAREVWSLDTASDDRGWQRCAPMHFPRVMPDAVLLPDGTVLVVNGACRGYAGGDAATGPAIPDDSVTVPELYDPQTDAWTRLAPAARKRLYHSTALLLPDGRVLVAGNDHDIAQDRRPKDGAEPCNEVALQPRQTLIELGFKLLKEPIARHKAHTFVYDVELFSPPYLLTGKPRPAIRDAPPVIRYGAAFEISVSDGGSLDLQRLRCALLRPGSVTHNNNMTQRHVELRLVGLEGDRLQIEAPGDEWRAPPGYYMLFLLHDGVPCEEAAFVRLQLRPGGRATDRRVSITGLAAWLRADSGVVADSQSHVATWLDLSGAGNNLDWIGHSGDDRLSCPAEVLPHGLNGQAAVRFSLVSSRNYPTPDSPNLDMRGGYFRSRRATFLEGSEPFEIFVVAHVWPGGPAGLGGLIGWGDFDCKTPAACIGVRLGYGPCEVDLPKVPGAASVEVYASASCSAKEAADAHRRVTADRPLTTMLRPILLEVRFDGRVATVHADQALIDQYELDRRTRAGPLLVGATGYATDHDDHRECFRGDIGEILIYSRVLEEGEREVLRAYLIERYSLS